MKILISTKQDAKKVGLPIGSIVDEIDAPQYLIDRTRNMLASKATSHNPAPTIFGKTPEECNRRFKTSW